jgi:formylglycine-generating enzyme required for sulfatase activity
MRLSEPKHALTRIASLLGVAAVGAGCGVEELPPLAQVVLFVDTDAPLPPPAGQAAHPDEPAALFDTARIEVYSRDDDDGPYSYEFAVDRDRIGAGASLGILSRPGTAGYSARMRLFRAAVLDQGEPRTESTIDVTIELPVVVDDQIEEVTVLLRTDWVGEPRGSREAPLQPDKGRPTTARVGTWEGAQRVPCGAPPAPDEVCVPGGAYWMGNPSVATFQITDPVNVQRLVVLEPFFLDKTEVTVGRFRDSGVAVAADPATTTSSSSLAEWCTYTPKPGETDQLPVNCLTWTKAREYCIAMGRDLVREAQFEYAAGGLRSSDFIWGHDEPSCTDAVFGRGGYGAFDETPAACKPAVGRGGVLPAGSGARDFLSVPTGTVLDLAGNVREYALDVWNTQDEPCWTATVLHDPECTQPGAVAGRAMRGGGWADARGGLLAARRLRVEEGNVSPLNGFRCARPGSGVTR